MKFCHVIKAPKKGEPLPPTPGKGVHGTHQEHELVYDKELAQKALKASLHRRTRRTKSVLP
jgi:hypothetical protein